MRFLAWREVRHAPVRFGLIAGLVALTAFLVFVLTGLTVGLGAADVSGLQRLPVDGIVYAKGAADDLSRSELPATDERLIAGVPGVTGVRPIGFTMAALAKGQNSVPTALLAMKDVDGGVVLDNQARGKGLNAGDTVTVQPGNLPLKITGFADLGSIQHSAVAYLPLADWQRLHHTQGVSAYAVSTSDDAALAAIARVATDTDPVTKAAAIDAVPGYQAETGTIGMIRSFLYAGAALLIGVVFWILTLQKEGPLAVLRATGASRRLLIGAYVTQVLATAVAGVVVGALAGVAMGVVMPPGVFVLPPGEVVTAGALLLVVALVGAAASVRRLFTADPLLSLGRTA
ncbi:ABC transporter permease [Kutzneria sp. CA-103260]|uniref:ABC transporter permease n=1 Tax=Kutzneria sp. CA-103260 TaxID=2802641 RepID=UPI001BADC3C1|nr:ABC transporter permease [Kutzneria sp. CA-103260]QUQ66012.1 ABC transporter permease [Kutzneria sp. CA-103260]